VSGYQDTYTNKCYRNGPCLQADQVKVSRADRWDYYDRSSKSYINLECRLNQKYYTPSLLQIEEAEKYQSGLGTQSYEHHDLQLYDSNGAWFTRSDDPELYRWPIGSEDPKECNICDIVCDIRDMKEYSRENGSCPYDDPTPQPVYSKVQDYDGSCRDFLHPLLLQDIKAINRKRARTTKAKLWGYLKQKKWRDALINKGDRMVDVWKRNYQPVKFYYDSFGSAYLYLKNLPQEMKKNKLLIQRVKDNLKYSPSFNNCSQEGEWEKRMFKNIDKFVEG
jgi:hypothetical protein